VSGSDRYIVTAPSVEDPFRGESEILRINKLENWNDCAGQRKKHPSHLTSIPKLALKYIDPGKIPSIKPLKTRTSKTF